jgi:hypothetical protein
MMLMLDFIQDKDVQANRQTSTPHLRAFLIGAGLGAVARQRGGRHGSAAARQLPGSRRCAAAQLGAPCAQPRLSALAQA